MIVDQGRQYNSSGQKQNTNCWAGNTTNKQSQMEGEKPTNNVKEASKATESIIKVEGAGACCSAQGVTLARRLSARTRLLPTISCRTAWTACRLSVKFCLVWNTGWNMASRRRRGCRPAAVIFSRRLNISSWGGGTSSLVQSISSSRAPCGGQILFNRAPRAWQFLEGHWFIFIAAGCCCLLVAFCCWVHIRP